VTTRLGDDVEFSIAQFRDAWKLLCGAADGYVFEQTAGIDYVFSGLPIPFFNAAVVTAGDVSADTLRAHGRDACAWAASKPVPWMFVVTHDALTPGVDAASELAACGLTPMLALTGMRAPSIPSRRAAGDGLQVATADDAAALAAIVDVNSAAYGVDLDASKTLLANPSFWAGHVPALGRVDGTPVASAAVMMVAGCRYVLLVATMPDRQRRGYAEAVMRHALDVAAATHGETPTTLHATDAGRPIYARMGYDTIATHTAFIEKRFLDGH
jgi:GNAT superfamily N-acetyltransferase